MTDNNSCQHKFEENADTPDIIIARVAVIGCGWWAQGWHLPHLAAHNMPRRGGRIQIAAVVNLTQNPTSTLTSSPLLSLSELATKYNCPCYSSVSDMLADEAVGPTLDGAIIATSHASHYQVGMSLLREGISRRQQHYEAYRVMNILMEKPMTTDVMEARSMWELSTISYPEGAFIINHTASYRPQTRIARHIIASNQIGKIRHISASMNGPLMWLFNDSTNHAWVSKTPWKNGSTTPDEVENAHNTDEQQRPMIGNGYAYGQIAHVLAWIYAVLGAGETKKQYNVADNDDHTDNTNIDIAIPTKVYCNMSHAINTGADISFAAVITCHDGVTFALSGTALLPGSQYADPPIGKHINIEMFGEEGCLLYCGDDRIPESGRLELRKTAIGKKEDGQSIFPCSDNERDWSTQLGDELKDGFYFEDGEQDGLGPGSMRVFLDACRNSAMQYARGMQHDMHPTTTSAVNDSLIGLRTVQVIDAMYRSSISGNVEEIMT